MPSDPYFNTGVWLASFSAINAVALLFVCYRLKRNPLLRSHIGYSILIATLGELLAMTLFTINHFSAPRIYVTSLIDSIGNSFSFLPVIIAFHKICLEQKYENGKYLGYFAYLWSTIIIATGLLYAVFLSNSDLVGLTFDYAEKCGTFLYHSYWGFIVLFFGFFGLFASSPRGLNRLQNRATISIAAYIFCLVLRILVNAVFANGEFFFSGAISLFTHNALVFFLADFPKIVAMVIAALYGHLWTSEFLIKSKCDTSTENKSIQDMPSESDQTSKPDGARNQRAKPDNNESQTSKPDGAKNQRIKPDAII